jgi:hypothetical protein
LNETGLLDITREIARLKGDRRDERLVRRLTFNYHRRLSLAYTAIPLGLIALCVSASAAGRRRPLAIGFVALGGYVAACYRCCTSVKRWRWRLVNLPSRQASWRGRRHQASVSWPLRASPRGGVPADSISRTTTRKVDLLLNAGVPRFSRRILRQLAAPLQHCFDQASQCLSGDCICEGETL